MTGIYKITNPNGKIYIGQALNIENRWKYYKRLSCKSQPAIYNSLIKYGVENHTFEVIEECEYFDINIKERHWQEYYDVLNPKKGLNCIYTKTDIMPRIVSKETRLKMSKAQKEMMTWKGKKHKAETIEKMKLNNKRATLGKKLSKEFCEKRSNYTKCGNNPRAIYVIHLETGIFYDNIKEACRVYNHNYTQTISELKHNKISKKCKLRYA